MSTAPRFSVIVPAFQAADFLPRTLRALRECRPPVGGFELIVVDDGSPDATAEVASRYADRVLRQAQPAGGASRARNAGAAVARGEWLLFVDADVAVHTDTMQRLTECLERHPDAVAVFGSYDAEPAAEGLVSRYRNLLHHYVHLRGAGEATTFWSGLGAVRRDLFLSLGGFEPHRWQLEDIQFGYRLRSRGGRIVLDPRIQGTHLKRWTLGAVVVTDFRDRAIPWMRLLLEGRNQGAASLNITRAERLKVLGAAIIAASLLGALLLADSRFAWVALGLTVALAASNFPVYRWFARERGSRFALAVIPLHLWYYFSNAAAAGVAVLEHLGTRLWSWVFFRTAARTDRESGSASKQIQPESAGSRQPEP